MADPRGNVGARLRDKYYQIYQGSAVYHLELGDAFDYQTHVIDLVNATCVRRNLNKRAFIVVDGGEHVLIMPPFGAVWMG